MGKRRYGGKKKEFGLQEIKLSPLDLMYSRIVILRRSTECLQFYRSGCFSYPKKKAFILYYGYDACQTDPYV